MADPFALPAGFAIGSGAPPGATPSPAGVTPAPYAPAIPSAASTPPAAASGGPPADPFALPQGFTVGAPPAQAGSTVAAPPPAPATPPPDSSSVTIRLPGGDVLQTPSVSPGTGQGALPDGSSPDAPIVLDPISVSRRPTAVPATPAGAPAATAGPGPAAGQPTAAPAPPVSRAAALGAMVAGSPPSAVTPPAAVGGAQAAPSPAMGPAVTSAVPDPGSGATPQPVAPSASGDGSTGLPYLGHLAGLAGRAGIEGALGLALGPAALAARGIDWATGTGAVSPVANAPAHLDNALTSIGLPQPQTTAERYGTAIAENVLPVLATGGLGAIGGVARAAEALPTAVQTLGHLLLAGGVPRTAQVLGGTSAGALQQYAADSGAGTKGQILASLLGAAVGGGAHAGLGAATDYAARLGVAGTGGRAGLAGQALLSQSSDPATFSQRLAAGTKEQAAGRSSARLPTSPATPGMLANDQGMMGFEQGIRNTTIGNDDYRAFDQARAASQVQAMRDLADPGAHSAQERGFTIRNALDQAHDAANARTSQLYQAAAPTAGRLSIDPLLHHIGGEMAGRFGPGSGGPPPELGEVWHEILSPPDHHHEATTLMRMSPRLGEMAGRLKMSGNRMAAQAAMQTRDAIEAIAGSPAWEQARATRRSQGETFGRNAEGTNAAGAIRAEDRFGSPMMQDDKVADRAIKDGAATRQIFHALERGIADARASGASAADIDRLEHNATDVMTAMREHFIDGLVRKGSVARDEHGNETLTITPRQWQRYWGDHADVAAHLFHPGERRLLDADFAEQQRFTDAGKANGSNTMKNAATARFMRNLSAGRIPGELRTARLLAVGMPIALAKGVTTGLDLVHPGVGRGLEHAAHRAGEVYFLSRGGHGAAHNVLSGVMNPGAHAVAEHVQEAAGDPAAVQHLLDAVRAGKVQRISAAVTSRPLRRRALDTLARRAFANSPGFSQAQQGNATPPQMRVAS